MFGMGMPEILLILAIALIVIGPKKLPELAKSLGRAMNEFKRATSELKDTMEIDYDMKEVKKTFDDIDSELKKPIDVSPVEKTESPDSGKPGDTKGEGEKAPDQLQAKAAPPADTGKAATADDEMTAATDIPAELAVAADNSDKAAPCDTAEADLARPAKGKADHDA